MQFLQTSGFHFSHNTMHLIFSKINNLHQNWVFTLKSWKMAIQSTLNRESDQWKRVINSNGLHYIISHDFLLPVCFCWRKRINFCFFFDVLLTVHLSIFISVIKQFDAQNFWFTISLFHTSTCFEHMCSSSGGQNCIIQPLVSSHL